MKSLLSVLVTLMSLAAHADTPPVGLKVPALTPRPASVPVELTVQDIKGSYTIPYIQSARELRVRLEFPAGVSEARVQLLRDGETIANATVKAGQPEVSFDELSPGEYSLRITTAGAEVTYTRLAIGTVIAALGDSITEGYHGHGFFHDDLNLRGSMFPAEAVSRDGRNFPQYSPTTSYHKPAVNCFQSWLTALNDRLAEAWRQPVFIANEGIGGITSGAYLNMIRHDAGWHQRMRQLQPQVWLIHLGVNDERHKVPAEELDRNLREIVAALRKDYGAAPERIFIARPCYDYVPEGPAVLQSYISRIDAVIAEQGLRSGPDFFCAYGVDKARWYGSDPVHPNVEGMEYMARLWAETLVKALPEGLRP